MHPLRPLVPPNTLLIVASEATWVSLHVQRAIEHTSAISPAKSHQWPAPARTISYPAGERLARVGSSLRVGVGQQPLEGAPDRAEGLRQKGFGIALKQVTQPRSGHLGMPE